MSSKKPPYLTHLSVLTGAEVFHLVAGALFDGGGAVTNEGNSRYSKLSDIATYILGLVPAGGITQAFADGRYLQLANNLSDVASAATARTNLGLGSAATFASTAFLLSTALDVDGTLAANSDTRVASQKAVRTYVAAQIAGGTTRPTVRAQRIITFTATAPPYSFALPVGTVAGDVLYLFVTVDNASSTPTGFVQVNQIGGSYIAGACYAKVMTAGDITAGTVSVPALGGSNSGCIAGVSLIGSTVKGTRKGALVANQLGVGTNGIAAANVVTLTAPNADPGGLVLVFAGYRSGNATNITFSAGITSLAASVAGHSGNIGYVNTSALVITMNETVTTSAAADGYYNIVLPIS